MNNIGGWTKKLHGGTVKQVYQETSAFSDQPQIHGPPELTHVQQYARYTV